MESNSSSQPNQQPLASQQQTDQLHSVSSTTSYSPSKTFIIILVLILIAIVGIGGYMVGANQNQIVQNQNQTLTPSIAIQPSPTVDPTVGWKTYSSTDGNYSVRYPNSWILEVITTNYKGHIVILNKTSETYDRPLDLGEVEVYIAPTSSRGVEYVNISQQDFFDPNNKFWRKGDVGGGGPGSTFLVPEETIIVGLKGMRQIRHPTKDYESAGTNHITIDYYLWVGKPDNEYVRLSFTYDDRNPNKELLIQRFNQILSTFRFD